MNVKLNRQNELKSLMRLIRRAVKAGSFALIFANCDSLGDQTHLQKELARRCSQSNINLTTIDLWGKAPIENLYLIIHEHLSKNFPNKLSSSLAIQVMGLEISILLDADERFPAVLQNLNLKREIFRAEITYPLLIWLPDYAYIKLANVAPDFWSVRNGVFTFLAKEQADLDYDLNRIVSEYKDLTEWRDKTTQIPLIERILNSQVPIPDKTKTDLMLKLGEAYRFVGKTNKAKENFEKALQLNQNQLDNIERKRIALNGLGLVYTDWGEFTKAIEYFEQYQALVRKQQNDEALAVGYNHLGFAQYRNGNLKDSIESYKKALEINRKLGKRQGEGDVLGNLGLVYRKLREFERAIEYHREALKISRELDRKQSEVKDLGNIGLVEYDRENYKEAIDSYDKALHLSQRIGNKQDELNQYLNLGDALRNMDKLDRAKENYKKAQQIAEELGFNGLNSVALEKLVELHGPKFLQDDEGEVDWVKKFVKQSKISGNLETQKHCLDKLLELCRRIDLPLLQKNDWLLEAHHLLKHNIPQDTITFYEKYIEILQNLGQADRAKLLQAKLEDLKRTRQLIIWLAPGSVEVEDEQPVMRTHQLYTFYIQRGGSIPKYAWIYHRDLPDETTQNKIEEQPREGFRISTISTEPVNNAESTEPTNVVTPAESVPPSLSSEISALKGRSLSNVGRRTTDIIQKKDELSLMYLKFQSDNLNLSPVLVTLPIRAKQSSDRVSLTVNPEKSGDQRILVTVTFPEHKIRDEFDIPLRVVENMALLNKGMISNAEEIVTLTDDRQRSLECYVENSLEIEDSIYLLLMPVDSPIVIIGSEEGSEDEEISEAVTIEEEIEIEQIFADAKAVLAELDLTLKHTAYTLTVTGELPPLEEDKIITIEFDEDNQKETEELQFLAGFYNGDRKYNIYTPITPLLFLARDNKIGQLTLVSPEDKMIQPILEELLFEELE